MAAARADAGGGRSRMLKAVAHVVVATALLSMFVDMDKPEEMDLLKMENYDNHALKNDIIINDIIINDNISDVNGNVNDNVNDNVNGIIINDINVNGNVNGNVNDNVTKTTAINCCVIAPMLEVDLFKNNINKNSTLNKIIIGNSSTDISRSVTIPKTETKLDMKINIDNIMIIATDNLHCRVIATLEADMLKYENNNNSIFNNVLYKTIPDVNHSAVMAPTLEVDLFKNIINKNSTLNKIIIGNSSTDINRSVTIPKTETKLDMNINNDNIMIIATDNLHCRVIATLEMDLLKMENNNNIATNVIMSTAITRCGTSKHETKLDMATNIIKIIVNATGNLLKGIIDDLPSNCALVTESGYQFCRHFIIMLVLVVCATVTASFAVVSHPSRHARRSSYRRRGNMAARSANLSNGCRWMSKAATHVVLVAALLSMFVDKPGEAEVDMFQNENNNNDHILNNNNIIDNNHKMGADLDRSVLAPKLEADMLKYENSNNSICKYVNNNITDVNHSAVMAPTLEVDLFKNNINKNSTLNKIIIDNPRTDTTRSDTIPMETKLDMKINNDNIMIIATDNLHCRVIATLEGTSYDVPKSTARSLSGRRHVSVPSTLALLMEGRYQCCCHFNILVVVVCAIAAVSFAVASDPSRHARSSTGKNTRRRDTQTTTSLTPPRSHGRLDMQNRKTADRKRRLAAAASVWAQRVIGTCSNVAGLWQRVADIASDTASRAKSWASGVWSVVYGVVSGVVLYFLGCIGCTCCSVILCALGMIPGFAIGWFFSLLAVAKSTCLLLIEVAISLFCHYLVGAALPLMWSALPWMWSALTTVGAAIMMISPWVVFAGSVVALAAGVVAICIRHAAETTTPAPIVARQACAQVVLWVGTSATAAAAAWYLALPPTAAVVGCSAGCVLAAAVLVQLAVGTLMFSPARKAAALLLFAAWCPIKLAIHIINWLCSIFSFIFGTRRASVRCRGLRPLLLNGRRAIAKAVSGAPAAAWKHRRALFMLLLALLAGTADAAGGDAPLIGFDSLAAIVMSIAWNDKKLWGGDTDYSELDTMCGHLLPLQSRPIKEHTGPKPTAVECVKRIVDNVNTAILATVFVKGWKLCWLVSVTMIILNSYSSCRFLNLHAIQGGEYANADEGTPPGERSIKTNCDGELRYICMLCEALGGEVGAAGRNCGKCTIWNWRFSRPGGAEFFYVTLTVHHDPDDINVETIAYDLHPEEDNATSPNLKRVAIVSSPVTIWDEELQENKRDDALLKKIAEEYDLDEEELIAKFKDDGLAERADQKLNKTVVAALEMVEANAEKHGWKTLDNWKEMYPNI